MGVLLRLVPMKRSRRPSESQVISSSVASRRGSSLSRWIGSTGNTWSIAHESGIDWNTEKLQKYLSARFFRRVLISSGKYFSRSDNFSIFLEIPQ